MAGTVKYNWKKIQDDFIRSDCTLRTISDRHGVNYHYLSSKASKQGWHQMRVKFQSEARQAVTDQLAAELESQNKMAGQIIVKDAEAQVKRSMQTGDRLYELFHVAVRAMSNGDLRTMRQAIDAWVTLDSHMRKVHNIDDNASKPVVNIAVLSALPDKPREVKVDSAVVEVSA